MDLPTVMSGLSIPATVKMKPLSANGVHLVFPSGVTVSVIWGVGSWTENRDARLEAPINSLDDFIAFMDQPRDSATAEVAIWQTGGAWITHEYTGDSDDDGQTLGYRTTDELQDIITWAAAYQP